MLAKMGVGRGDTPEVSPLLRAEDGRVGEATRDAAPVEDDQDSPSTSGWFASRGARVATAAVLGVMVIGCVVGGVTMRTISLATHDTSSGARLPERAHRHRPEGVSDLPEVFVVTGEDAEGPIGEWLRVDEETKAKMEAEARRKMETKKAKAAAKLAKAARKAGPHRGHAEAAVGEAQLVQDLTLSSEDDAAKLAKYNEDKAFKNALETDAGGGLHGGHHLVREDLEDANAVHVVEHPTTRAQRAELEALKKQEENMAEVEEREREWARQQRLEAAEETPSTPSADAVRTASGDVSSSRVLSRVGYSGEDAARDAAKDGGDVWATTDLDPAKASCAASLRDPDVPTKPLFDAGLYFNPNRPDGDPGTRGDFGPRARAVRDTTFASALYLGVPDEDVADRVAAARDAACNAGRARLNLHFFAENDAVCRFVKAHYVAGREASERAANDGPTSTDPATPMPRLGGGRFDCAARAAAALPLQPPKAPLANAPEGAACGNARAAAPWYNKAAFVVETADAARSGAIPQTARYAWFDADQPGSTLLQALLEHPFDADASESMPTRVHFKCHASAAREQQAVDPCGARAGFVAPKLFVGSELAARKLAKRFAAYARAYLPLEDTAGDWRYARGYFDDYTRINFEDVEAETPLVESPIVANGETGAWSCPCPTEEYVLNRLWNDELFPGENDASALPEELSRWGGNEAVAAVGGGFELQPGLKLMDRDVRVVLPTAETDETDTDTEMSSAAEASAAEASSHGSASATVAAEEAPKRRAAALGAGFEDQFAEAAAMMNVAAALAGDASAMHELEKLKALRAARESESPAEEAARLAEETASARENPTAEAPKVDLSTREHQIPEHNEAGFLIDAEADSRDSQCARVPEKPTSFAELPSMGLRKWHF